MGAERGGIESVSLKTAGDPKKGVLPKLTAPLVKDCAFLLVMHLAKKEDEV